METTRNYRLASNVSPRFIELPWISSGLHAVQKYGGWGSRQSGYTKAWHIRHRAPHALHLGALRTIRFLPDILHPHGAKPEFDGLSGSFVPGAPVPVYAGHENHSKAILQ